MDSHPSARPLASAMADPDSFGPYLRRNSPGHDVHGHRPHLRHQYRPDRDHRNSPRSVVGLAALSRKVELDGRAWERLCALGGVVTTLILQMDASPESMAAARMQGGVGYGEFFAAAATVLLVCGAEIGRKQLQTIPLGIFSVFRNLVGALFFLGIGLYIFGLEHFADIFSPCSGAGCCCTEGLWWLAVS